MAGALPLGPPQGPAGPNQTNLGSNRGLTRENWSLQVDAPAMLREDADLRDTDVVEARSGRNRLRITKLLQWLEFSKLCVCGEGISRLMYRLGG
ncbi:hypothetical protein F511_19825 [Dorcoceras hygrometricum]|uniref:Uncharacterized protein n=1 Tax=Dorcoceras hygrometricum TaxID=472368 RepID=A0A2Z7DB02_9LAMI|nr:hypothetical protein F511_19825 [Dorcoceras hygrometricum]